MAVEDDARSTSGPLYLNIVEDRRREDGRRAASLMCELLIAAAPLGGAAAVAFLTGIVIVKGATNDKEASTPWPCRPITFRVTV